MVSTFGLEYKFFDEIDDRTCTKIFNCSLQTYNLMYNSYFSHGHISGNVIDKTL